MSSYLAILHTELKIGWIVLLHLPRSLSVKKTYEIKIDNYTNSNIKK